MSALPSTPSAEKVKADKDVAAPLKELGLRVSKFLVSEVLPGYFLSLHLQCIVGFLEFEGAS